MTIKQDKQKKDETVQLAVRIDLKVNSNDSMCANVLIDGAPKDRDDVTNMLIKKSAVSRFFEGIQSLSFIDFEKNEKSIWINKNNINTIEVINCEFI